MGRPPLFGTAMSGSQRQRRWREQQAAARALLEKAGLGAELAASDRAKILATAHANVERANRDAKLRDEAKQAARHALNAITLAFLAQDRHSNTTPTEQQRAERATIEAVFRKMGGVR